MPKTIMHFLVNEVINMLQVSEASFLPCVFLLFVVASTKIRIVVSVVNPVETWPAVGFSVRRKIVHHI